MAAFCTAFYSMRLSYMTFLNNTNAFRNSVEHTHDVAPIVLFCTVSFGRGFYLIRIFRSRYVLRCWNSFLGKCFILWLNNNINFRTSLFNDCNKIPTPSLYYSRGISSFLSVYIPSKCNFYFNIPPVCTTYLCFL